MPDNEQKKYAIPNNGEGWQTGDVITKEKMNTISNALAFTSEEIDNAINGTIYGQKNNDILARKLDGLVKYFTTDPDNNNLEYTRFYAKQLKENDQQIIVPTLDEYNSFTEDMNNNYTNFKQNFVQPYSKDKAYAKGEYVEYNEEVYKLLAPVAAKVSAQDDSAAWNTISDDNKQKVNVMQELGGLINVYNNESQLSQEKNKIWIKTQSNEVQVPTYEEFSDLKSAETNVNNAVVDGGNLKKTFNWQYGSINSDGVETGNTTTYYARTIGFYSPESSSIVVTLANSTTYFVKVGYNADGTFASGSRKAIDAQSTLTVELDTTLKYRFVIMMASGSYDLTSMDDYLTISVPTKIAENTANISANKGILDVLKQPLPITWDIGYEYANATGVKTASATMATGSLIYCANGGRIYNNSDAKDANNKTLVGYIAKYRGGVYVGTETFGAGGEYTIPENITSIGISIGRYSSSEVDFSASDLSLFSFSGYINQPIPVADPYLALPSRQITKYRYIWHDNFHRANDGTGLGTNGDTDYPMTYEYAGAQLAISGNACVNTQAAKGIAYADMGYSDCVIEYQADLSDVELTTRGYGICFRRTDNNNFFSCQLRKENIKINKIENGTNTEIGNISVTSADKAPKKISVELEGSKIRIYTNGVMVRELSDSFNHTATIHGLYLDNYTSGNNGKILNFGVKIKDTWHPMVDQMDSGTLPYNIVAENPGYDYNFGFSYNTVCNSNTSLRFENRVVDSMSVANKRSEISVKGYGRMLDEQMFEWDMMLGDDYAVVDPTSEIIMQMHDISDSGQTEVGTSPSFEIHVKDGHYFVHRQYSEYKTFYDTSHITVQNTDIGSYLDDVGKWVHWTFHIKWAYNDFFEPFIYLYKNGELVYKSVLPNVINAAHVPYFKVGIYTFNWVEHPDQTVATVRTMYVDNIRPSY